MLDLIIVGAGPIGLTCAIEAQRNGLSYLIIEKGTLVNSLYHYPLYMTFFSTAERLEIGNLPFNCIAPKPGRQEALEYYRNVTRHFNLNLHLYERVDTITPTNGHFEVNTDKATYSAAHVVAATGFYDVPNYMNVPGESLPKVRHYYKEPHPYTHQKVIVVGASNSSVDAALETWRKGADVTMVVRGATIGDRVKYWVRPDIENRIAEGSIKAYFNSNITEIRPNEVDLETPAGLVTIENDAVLALTGYRPDLDWLAACGVRLDPADNYKPTYDPATMQTNVPGLYLAGVVCGGLATHKWFIENSREHAALIVNNILRSKSSG
ncbi:MAG: YpdA family putative bacillithiol disulfide reductase [Edaphocola sp.]